jgi:hypothetical protein
MQTQGRISIAALAATAALFAIPASASAATYGTITVKAPSCSKASSAKVTVTATPKGGSTVGVLAVSLGALSLTSAATPPKILFSLLYGASKPVISGKVPVGKKVTATAIFSGGSGGGGFLSKVFTVKKCAAFTG